MRNLTLGLTLAITLLLQFSYAQNEVIIDANRTAINANGASPNASSILDVQSTNKGILIPRMTSAQRIAINSPAKGLLVFDLTADEFWFYDGSSWSTLGTDNLGNHVATQNISMGLNKITNLGFPTGNNDAARKGYVDNHTDGDSDPNNEIETWATLGGIPSDFADGMDNVNDADASPTNETITNINLSGTTLQITEAGATNSVSLNSLGGSFETLGTLVRNGGNNATDDFVFGKASLPSTGILTDQFYFFDKSNGAFRAGIQQSGTTWSPSKIGLGSFASGRNSEASGVLAFSHGHYTSSTGDYSTSLGFYTDASGDYSSTLGYYTDAEGPYSIAAGNNTLASGSASSAFGDGCTASGTYSFAAGRNCIASGEGSTAFGSGDATAYYTTASGFGIASEQFATAFGKGDATGEYSTASGSGEASGNYSTAFGQNTLAIGDHSFAGGESNEANGKHSATFGRDNFSDGENSFTFGRFCTASGKDAIAGGEDCIAVGDNSIAIGSSAITNNNNSIALGLINTSSGNQAVTIGSLSSSTGVFSFSLGSYNKSKGSYSASVGTNLVSNAYASLAVGRYNDSIVSPKTFYSTNQPAFIVGNGSSETSRGNAFMVTYAGDALIDNKLLPMVDDQSDLGSTTFRFDDVYATNGTIQTSDLRAKKNVDDLSYGLTEVLELETIQYNWNKESNTDKKHLGVSAQQLLALIPEVVVESENEEDLLGVKYAELTPVLIKAIQELKEENDELKKELASSQEKFEARLLQIENALNPVQISTSQITKK